LQNKRRYGTNHSNGNKNSNGNGNGNGNRNGGNGNGSNKKNSGNGKIGKLSAKQVAVIAALLTNALEVKSILIDTDQTVQIVLEGSFRKKTRMDEILNELSDMTMGDFWDAIQRKSQS
jgi:hypothetical protein